MSLQGRAVFRRGSSRYRGLLPFRRFGREAENTVVRSVCTESFNGNIRGAFGRLVVMFVLISSKDVASVCPCQGAPSISISLIVPLHPSREGQQISIAALNQPTTRQPSMLSMLSCDRLNQGFYWLRICVVTEPVWIRVPKDSVSYRVDNFTETIQEQDWERCKERPQVIFKTLHAPLPIRRSGEQRSRSPSRAHPGGLHSGPEVRDARSAYGRGSLVTPF